MFRLDFNQFCLTEVERLCLGTLVIDLPCRGHAYSVVLKVIYGVVIVEEDVAQDVHGGGEEVLGDQEGKHFRNDPDEYGVLHS